jgi:CRP-like cAMP-binding protein
VSREHVLNALKSQIQRDFGMLLAVRDVRRRRRVAGQSWLASIVVVASAGDIPVGEFEVDDDGVIANALRVDQVVDAIRARAATPEPAIAELDEFADMMVDSRVGLAVPDSEDGARTAAVVHERALARGDKASLRGAREILPRFLAEAEMRGQTLMLMADIERRLGEARLAGSYLEAAARDFADRFDIAQLELCARAARELLGVEDFARSPVANLLAQNLARLRPLSQLFDAQGLRGLTRDQQAWLENNALLRTLTPGEFLVKEGDPSLSVFVIKSGLVAVLLETASGVQRMVRCCYPGWLLGESSVLSEKGARCTASLRAERSTEVWAVEASVLAMIMAQNDGLKKRISATKHIHRIDSFFSMHETLGQLDVAVRDEVLGCLHSIQVIEDDAVAVTAGEVPTVSCLVARGELALYADVDPVVSDPPIAVIDSDQFFGVRDALHSIASARTAVARRGSTIVFFDAERLRALAQRSSAMVVATLERLG